MSTESKPKPALKPSPPPEGAILLTYPEAALMLRCSVSHVYREVAAGRLAYRKSGRKAFIHREDLERYVAEIRRVERPEGEGQGSEAPQPDRLSLRKSGLWDGDDFGAKRKGRRV
jgi:excisionase family DNA binding protein